MNGITMIAEDQAGGEHADADRAGPEQGADARDIARACRSATAAVCLQERREHEQAPDAVDDAGDAGQQLDGDADRPAQPGA